jgi:hypothetical protein
MRSSADVLGLFSINVVSFSRNLVLRGLFASCVHVVGKGWSLRLHRWCTLLAKAGAFAYIGGARGGKGWSLRLHR